MQRNPPGTPKPWTIAHENGQKCQKSRVLTMPLEPCTGGHGASKSSQDPKNVDCGPRKRIEIREITSFDDGAIVVYRGHGASKSSRDPKTVDYSPRKWPEMLEIMSFDDAARVMYWGSRGIKILPGPEKRGLIAHANGQKCSKSRVLTMPLESCTGGHGASKSSRKPTKTARNARNHEF